MATKHKMIIQYIDNLPIGEKISVRTIAKSMNISEGTAYRAIKECENIGIVSTIPRVGTIRIERKTKHNFEHLTFEAIEKIIEGKVLGGHQGMHKPLNKFIIGAMQEDAMLRYISAESLMIVGNRISVQQLALESGAAVLITGGFETTPEMIALADKVELPILTTSYDTFTVATLINRAMSDQLIKKEIVLVDNIYTPFEKTEYLTTLHTVYDYRELSQNSNHTRFPIINPQGRLVGIVTSKDILKKQDNVSLEKIMTKNPQVARLYMSIASVAHMMIWDGLDVVPVVDDNLKLIGIISRGDVMKSLQFSQRQPQVGNTIEDQMVASLNENSNEFGMYSFQVEPQLLNGMGTLSYGVLCEMVTTACEKYLITTNQVGVILEHMHMHYFKLIQNENILSINCQILDFNRRSVKVDVSVFIEQQLVAKATLAYQKN